jgi:hypothetical protein
VLGLLTLESSVAMRTLINANLQFVVETLVANIRYLQDEFAALLVKGRFDQITAQFFRSLQRNNYAECHAISNDLVK